MLDNVVCLLHPKYVGEHSPVLSCKVCCAKYIAAIKKLQMSRRAQTEVDLNLQSSADLAKTGISPRGN